MAVVRFIGLFVFGFFSVQAVFRVIEGNEAAAIYMLLISVVGLFLGLLAMIAQLDQGR